jgi:hypothetical protein
MQYIIYFLILFIGIVVIGSLIEEYMVNKTIKFKSWKSRFFNWINRLLQL